MLVLQIAQEPYVGRIDCWPQWLPTSNKTMWLLLSGASDPPSGISISDRRTKDTPGERRGTFLAGVTNDLLNMEAAVGDKLFNTVKDLYLTKSTASDHIQKFFDTCKLEEVKPILYYTGHGEIGTGNWCFADGTISIQEILDMRPEGTYYPMNLQRCLLQRPLGKLLPCKEHPRIPLPGSMSGVF